MALSYPNEQDETMVKKSDIYRARAAVCEVKAEQAKDRQAKQLLREAAQDWYSLATLSEQHGSEADAKRQ